jgi:hypothetical protein
MSIPRAEIRELLGATGILFREHVDRLRDSLEPLAMPPGS